MDLIIVDFRSQFCGISALPIHVSGTRLGERGREGAGEKGGRPLCCLRPFITAQSVRCKFARPAQSPIYSPVQAVVLLLGCCFGLLHGGLAVSEPTNWLIQGCASKEGLKC